MSYFTNAREYVNQNYNYKVTIPESYKVCVAQPPNPNHGITFYFDRNKKCETEIKSNAISISAEFNSNFYTLEEFMKLYCKKPSLNLKFKNRDSMSCRSTIKKAWIDTFVFTHSDEKTKDGEVPKIYYVTWLHSDKKTSLKIL